MDKIFEQQLESKRNELISLNAAYGGEFRSEELHIVVNQIGEIRIGIAYTLSPSKAVYFYAGYGHFQQAVCYSNASIPFRHPSRQTINQRIV